MASYAYLIAPPEAASTLQGIFGALFEGIGIACISLLKFSDFLLYTLSSRLRTANT